MGEWVGGQKEEERREGKKGKNNRALGKGSPPHKAAGTVWFGQSTCNKFFGSDHIRRLMCIER